MDSNQGDDNEPKVQSEFLRQIYANYHERQKLNQGKSHTDDKTSSTEVKSSTSMEASASVESTTQTISCHMEQTGCKSVQATVETSSCSIQTSPIATCSVAQPHSTHTETTSSSFPATSSSVPKIVKAVPKEDLVEELSVEQKKELFKRKMLQEDFTSKKAKLKTAALPVLGQPATSSKIGQPTGEIIKSTKDPEMSESQRLEEFKQKLLQGESTAKKRKPVFARLLSSSMTEDFSNQGQSRIREEVRQELKSYKLKKVSEFEEDENTSPSNETSRVSTPPRPTVLRETEQNTPGSPVAILSMSIQKPSSPVAIAVANFNKFGQKPNSPVKSTVASKALTSGKSVPSTLTSTSGVGPLVTSTDTDNTPVNYYSILQKTRAQRLRNRSNLEEEQPAPDESEDPSTESEPAVEEELEEKGDEVDTFKLIEERRSKRMSKYNQSTAAFATALKRFRESSIEKDEGERLNKNANTSDRMTYTLQRGPCSANTSIDMASANTSTFEGAQYSANTSAMDVAPCSVNVSVGPDTSAMEVTSTNTSAQLDFSADIPSSSANTSAQLSFSMEAVASTSANTSALNYSTEVREISVLEPKDGSLYPCLDKASVLETSEEDVNQDPEVLKTPVASTAIPSLYTPDMTMKSQDEMATRSLKRSVSEYRREQREMRTPVRKSEEGITVNSKVTKQEDKLVEDKRVKMNLNLTILQRQENQTDAAVKSAIANPQFKNEIQAFEAQSLNLCVKANIRVCNEELNRLEIERTVRPKKQTLFADEGKIVIKSLALHLEKDRVDTYSMKHYAFCLIYVEDTVTKTPVVLLDSSLYNPETKSFKIQENIVIKDVMSSFDAKIEVYALKTPNIHETPKKSKSAKYNKAGALVSSLPDNEFSLCAYAVFSLAQLNQKSYTVFSAGPSDRVIFPWASNKPLLLNFEFVTKNTIEFEDFLNVYDKPGSSIELRYCKLDAYTFRMYRYPSDTVPVRELEIKKITGKPTRAPSDMCINPHSFYITTESADKTSKVNLFTCTSKRKMEEWMAAFNLYLNMIKVD
uniref:PH domain-containing protein n=1 Tax=Cacopsylla melanoneura TaxID=428564 RepID=A0A8D9AWX3_9HEMI